MNWFAWQQHKKLFLLSGLLIATYAITLFVVGAHDASAYHHMQSIGKADYYQEPTLAHVLPPATIFLPLLLGLFWGVPLFATEYAEGTNKLVWTIGVSRKKWLTVKLAWILIIAALYAGILSFATMYASRTHNAMFLDRFQVDYFNTEGFMPVVYSLFTVATGAFLGIWLKRIMPALALLIFLFVITQIGIGLYARQHYMTTSTADIVSVTTNENDGSSSTTVSTVSLGAILMVNEYTPKNVSLCATNGSTNCDQTLVEVYHPASQYWDFQRIEAGIYIAISLIPIALSYWLVLRRDA